MNHGVAITEAAGKDSGVLVFGGHDWSQPMERSEVCRRRQGNQWSTGRVGCVSDNPLSAIFDPRQTRIFHAPCFF